MTTINFIGCGKVGKTLARLFVDKKSAVVKGVCNLNEKSAQAAVDFIREGKSYTDITQLSFADIYFITTTDSAIEKVCEDLVRCNLLKKGVIVVHCSGSLSSEILKKARGAGCYTASIHPLKSFAHPEVSITDFAGTFCSYEGDEEAYFILHRLFSSIGAIVFRIKKEYKPLYHTASVIANNYLIALHYTASQCYQKSGIEPAMASKIASQLMQEALKNLNSLSHTDALTGPLQRGDIETVKENLSALNNLPEIKNLYIILAERLLLIAKISEEKKAAFLTLFNKIQDKNL